LFFLKFTVSPLVDRDEPEEEALIQSLVCQLLSSHFIPSTNHLMGGLENENAYSSDLKHVSQLSSGLPASLPQLNTTSSSKQHSDYMSQRTAVFEQMMHYVKTGVREPDGDLNDLWRAGQ